MCRTFARERIWLKVRHMGCPRSFLVEPSAYLPSPSILVIQTHQQNALGTFIPFSSDFLMCVHSSVIPESPKSTESHSMSGIRIIIWAIFTSALFSFNSWKPYPKPVQPFSLRKRHVRTRQHNCTDSAHGIPKFTSEAISRMSKRRTIPNDIFLHGPALNVKSCCCAG